MGVHRPERPGDRLLRALSGSERAEVDGALTVQAVALLQDDPANLQGQDGGELRARALELRGAPLR
eukprot:8602585-Alexandrium_andersonii.AAC.1